MHFYIKHIVDVLEENKVFTHSYFKNYSKRKVRSRPLNNCLHMPFKDGCNK